MNTFEEIYNGFTLMPEGNTKPVIQSDEYRFFVLRIDGYSVAIEYDYEDEILEKFSKFEMHTKTFQSDIKPLKLLMLTLHGVETSIRDFARICESFVEIDNREKILKDPLLWWNEWTDLVGNKKVESRVYSTIAELLVYKYILKDDPTAVWSNKATHDIETKTANHEVKSSLKKHETKIHVNSEYQLSKYENPTFLYFVRLERSFDGVSLREVIDSFDEINQPEIKEELVKKTLTIETHILDQKYNVLEIRRYYIDDNFPILKLENDKIPECISHISYEVDLTTIPFDQIYGTSQNDNIPLNVPSTRFVGNTNFRDEFQSLNAQILEMKKTADEILKGVQENIDLSRNIESGVEDVKEQIQDLTDFALTLPDTISDERKILGEAIEKAKNEQPEVIEEMLEEFMENMSDKIVTETQNTVMSKELFDKELEKIKKYFGNRINYLQESTVKKLVTANCLLDVSDNLDVLDYSSVVILLTTSLEQEMRKYLFDDFKEYLHNKGIGIERWPEKLLYTKKTYNGYQKIEGTIFMMGDIFYLFTPDQLSKNKRVVSTNIRYDDIRMLNGYLTSITNKPNPYSYLVDIDFVDKIENIRQNYRNKCAHEGGLTIEEARTCSNLVVGNYEVEELQEQVFGVLRDFVYALK